jgi:anti-anti-sigma factor
LLDFSSPIRPDDFFDGHTVVTHSVDRLGAALAVQGDLDLASAPRLARRIHEALCLPVGRVTVDLSGVEFMDSQGLHVLEEARIAAAERHIDLVLASPSRCVRQLLDLACMTRLFDVRAR